jgi:parvulin-like peptidyl-prolyl isomerase
MLPALRRFGPLALVLGLAGRPAAAQEKMPAPAPVPSRPATVPTGNEALVNGQAVSRKAIFRSLQRVPEDRRAEERIRVLNFLIDNVLIDQEMVRQKVQVTSKEVDARIEEIRKEIKKSGKDFDRVMKELLLTGEELRAQVEADLRWDKYCTAKATDQALRAFFEQKTALFDGSLVHARHILITPGKDADTSQQAKTKLALIRKQIEDRVTQGLAKLDAKADNPKREGARTRLLDEAFAEAAAKESDCPTKARGGDLGWFPRGRMVEPFAKVAFALKPFQLSAIVTSPVGHHLILVLDAKPGKPVKFDSVKEFVKDAYCDRLREELLTKLRPAAKIVLNPPSR